MKATVRPAHELTDVELDFADDFADAYDRVEVVRLPSDVLVDRFAITRSEYLQAMKGDT